MVVLVVLDSTLHALRAETQRGLHFHDEFLIDGAWHLVVMVILILRVVEPVPRMLLQLVDRDTFIRIRHKYLREDVFGVA